MHATGLSPFPQLWIMQNPMEGIVQLLGWMVFVGFFLVREGLSTPQRTQHSNHTAKYYMMSFPELIFNFLTSLHEKFSNCLGGHLEACADLIAGVQTCGLSEEFL